MTNRILENMKKDQLSLGVIVPFPSPDMVDLAGFVGCDFVCLDAEHGAFSAEALEHLARAAEAAKTTAIARVSVPSAPMINQFLDRGLLGIVAPHIDTAEQAELLVRACRFAPEGTRSVGGNRGTFWDALEKPLEFQAERNREILVVAQIESREAVDNLDEILKVGGIDLFAFGVNDLAQSMGYPGQPHHPDMKKIREDVATKIRRSGRKMDYDVARCCFLPELLINSLRSFLDETRKEPTTALLGLV